MPKFAKVVTGMRGPGSNPEFTPDGKQEGLPAYLRPKSDPEKANLKPTVFCSKSQGLILSLTSGADMTDPRTGRIIPGKHLRAVFKHGEFALDPRDPEYDLKYAIITAHPKFGIGKDIWLRDEAIKLGEEARYQEVKKQFKANPEELKRLLSDIQGEEFPLTETVPEKQEASAQ